MEVICDDCKVCILKLMGNCKGRDNVCVEDEEKRWSMAFFLSENE